MWFWRTVHAYIEICNRKGLKKKHRALQVRVFHIIHANGGAAARPENCAWSTSEKLQKYNSEYDVFDFCHYCTLQIEAHWIQAPLCVMNVHICPRVHWNRSPFERDTGFCAIGVANATGSRYHFMCVEMR